MGGGWRTSSSVIYGRLTRLLLLLVRVVTVLIDAKDRPLAADAGAAVSEAVIQRSEDDSSPSAYFNVE
jgi:hypothetical protein